MPFPYKLRSIHRVAQCTTFSMVDNNAYPLHRRVRALQHKYFRVNLRGPKLCSILLRLPLATFFCGRGTLSFNPTEGKRGRYISVH